MNTFDDTLIIGFNISNTYDKLLSGKGVKIEKAELADYVFGVAHCKVVGVFKPHKWYYTEPGNRKTRIQFDGEEILDSPYLGMDLSDYFKGIQNPVRYIGNWLNV